MLRHSVVLHFVSRATNHDPIFWPVGSRNSAHKSNGRPRKTHYEDASRESAAAGSDDLADGSIYTK